MFRSFLFATVFLAATYAVATPCPVPSRDAFERACDEARRIFAGTVVARDTVRAWPDGRDGRSILTLEVRFRVTHVWKGDVTGEATARMDDSYFARNYRFDVGENYIVYVNEFKGMPWIQPRSYTPFDLQLAARHCLGQPVYMETGAEWPVVTRDDILWAIRGPDALAAEHGLGALFFLTHDDLDTAFVELGEFSADEHCPELRRNAIRYALRMLRTRDEITTGANAAKETTEKPTARVLASTGTLDQNVPNPFNPETTIEYAVDGVAAIDLRVFDLTGATVRTLVNGTQPAGKKSVVWDGTNDAGDPVVSGTYLYSLRIDGRVIATKKAVMLK